MKFFCLSFLIVLVLISGCATSQPDTITPIQKQLASLRTEVRNINTRSEEALRNTEDGERQITAFETKISTVEKALVAQNDLLKRLANESADTSKLNELLKAKANANDVNTINNSMKELVTAIKDLKQENVNLRRDFGKDLEALQNYIKSVEAKANDNSTKIANLSKTATAPATTTRPPTTAPVERTGKPSKPSISYDNFYEHFVESEETLSKIASIYKVAVQDIYNVNPTLKDPNSIRVGQKIMIPVNNE